MTSAALDFSPNPARLQPSDRLTIGRSINLAAKRDDMDFSPNDLRDETEVCRSRAEASLQPGAEAYARLLTLAETRASGQIRLVVRFLAATYKSHDSRFDPSDLRAVDAAIGDDMLQCLDTLRWALADLYKLVPDGEARVRAVLNRWYLH